MTAETWNQNSHLFPCWGRLQIPQGLHPPLPQTPEMLLLAEHWAQQLQCWGEPVQPVAPGTQGYTRKVPGTPQSQARSSGLSFFCKRLPGSRDRLLNPPSSKPCVISETLLWCSGAAVCLLAHNAVWTCPASCQHVFGSWMYQPGTPGKQSPHL